MRHLRITKYDPKYREQNDVYTKNEWFNFGCIGSIYEDKIVTIEDYEIVESKYLDTIEISYTLSDLPELYIHKLEITDDENVLENEVVEIINKGKISNNYELRLICKSIFRLLIWCELFTSDSQFGIEIYSDMYLYIITDNDEFEKLLKNKLPHGIFLE